MVHAWIPKASPATMQAGQVAEQAEQAAEDSYVGMMAPPCVACGQPVADKDYDRHKYEAHQVNEMVQPVGRPDAREAVFLAHSRDELARKVAVWRSAHPGLRLAYAADGTLYKGRLVFIRYRVLDARGRART